jgi:hypothetical protein
MSVYFGNVYNAFEEAYAGTFWRQLWLRVTGRFQTLCDLRRAATAVGIKNRRYEGLQSVPLHQIQGSEGRAQEFTRDFRPLRRHTSERWLRVARAAAQDYGLPPVSLIRFGDIYYVRDGHHRVSVARARGQLVIEAQVTVWEV